MERITLQSLAVELKMDPSALRKACLKLGLTPQKIRTLASRGQAMLALTPTDAAKMRQHYQWRIVEQPTTHPALRHIPTSSGGLSAAEYDALVLRCGIPESVAAALWFYYVIGLNAHAKHSAEWESIVKREARLVSDWIDSKEEGDA